ncbi:protease Do-like 10, mitochondrial isoform X5 [Macadamia integrifolia]|uniref:protease Do-like 10, mitochondrial isoform X5 n=1 Tax=Macadamia integrifolia TaxID=60698 RepID=UPI001C4EF60F|nr:protease Do-like 10, mitochondrial isoform X5 [Macadamia integrifolia]
MFTTSVRTARRLCYARSLICHIPLPFSSKAISVSSTLSRALLCSSSVTATAAVTVTTCFYSTSGTNHLDLIRDNTNNSNRNTAYPVSDGKELVSPRYTDAYAAIELALDSVVKVFTVTSSPNYFLPWQNKSQRESMGSGGDNISVTKGVVSRVEPTQYVHGATQLMAIQIDAAINPGNSGGPAIMGDKVVGVAFQNLSGAENIGYIIPVPVIKHFISGVEECGKYVGFCSLGLSCQPAENVQLREHFRMHPEMTGVLISKINPLADAYRVLKKDDIILAFDGVPIANDGTVPFRNRERIAFDHLVSMKKPNETAEVRVLRDGVENEFSITLQPLQPLVPVHQFDRLPSYFIFAGLVFIPLTQPFLHEYGEDWYNTSPRRLCESALRELPKMAGEQLVILSQLLMDDINAGYERLAELQVKKVNDVEVKNLKHLRQLVDGCGEGSLRFDLDDERVIVLNYQLAKVATSRILKRHRIPSAMSNDLIDKHEVEVGTDLASPS